MSYVTSSSGVTLGGSGSTGSASSVLGKDDFLELLVAKLSNQDPMNPESDESFIAELAQFSSLEQMNNIAEAITTSNQWDYLQMQSLNNIMASGLIGTEVRASYDSIYLESGDATKVSVKLDRFASNLEMQVYDENGTLVATVKESDLTAGAHSLQWDGNDSIGNRMADGTYTVKVKAYDVDGEEFSPSLTLQGIVQSVIYRDGSAYLNVDGVEIAFGDVTWIGAPSEDGEDNG